MIEMIARIKRAYLTVMFPLFVAGLFYNPITAISGTIVFVFMIMERFA